MINQYRELPAGEFKTTCLKLMDEVAQDRRTVTVTKHGKPVARLVPIKDQPGSPFGWLKGSVTLSGDIVGVGGQISNSVS
jgi:prevent-host-death family protein